MSQIVSDNILSMEERGQRIERVVDIYESAEAMRGRETSMVMENNDSTGNLQTQNAGGNIAKISYHRLMAASLVLLFFILLVVVIMLGVMFNTQTTAVNQLRTENNNLMLSRDQLQINYNSLTVEQRWLNSSYTNLTQERNQLQKERDELKSLLSALKNGWSSFNSSIYYNSTGMKTWNESQQDCKARGADLLIINNNEEKEFIEWLKGSAWVWIGLTDIVDDGTWKWMDGSTLTYTYWEDGEPGTILDEDCAQFREKWHDFSCNNFSAWICEKRI